jgi:hypothetical protein
LTGFVFSFWEMNILPDGWIEKFDKKRNRNYYYNKKTKISSWHKPEALDVNEEERLSSDISVSPQDSPPPLSFPVQISTLPQNSPPRNSLPQISSPQHITTSSQQLSHFTSPLKKWVTSPHFSKSGSLHLTSPMLPP